jgi:hypothetical protein
MPLSFVPLSIQNGSEVDPKQGKFKFPNQDLEKIRIPLDPDSQHCGAASFYGGSALGRFSMLLQL